MPGKGFSFFKELKRRKVYRVATVYALTGWIIAQIAAVTFPYLHLPDWVITTVIVLVIIGFPVALVLAWAFEVSPDGIIRTTSPEAHKNPHPAHKRKPFTSTTTIVILIILLITQFVYFRFIYHHTQKESTPVVEASLLPQKSIAVLPFKNMSEEKDNQYFSDGVMEAILNNLSRIKDLKVVSRTSVERFRDNSTKPLSEIANELEVANILEGSVQKVGNNVRIVVQLIAADKDEHIWATHYDRDISDIFAVQSEIAKTIADNLQIILTAKEKEIIENAPTSNLKAYDFYLKATSKHPNALGERERAKDLSETEKAIGMLKEVIQMDSGFSLAYSELGYYLYQLKNFGASRKIWYDSSLAVLNKSTLLDPANADAYLYKSYIYYKLYAFKKQEESLNLGLQYDPNNYNILLELGTYYLRTGNYDQGIDLLLKALSRSKPDKNSEDYYIRIANTFENIDREFTEKILKKGLKVFPESYNIMRMLAWTTLYNSEFEECIFFRNKTQAIKPDYPEYYDNLAYASFFLKKYKPAEENFMKDKQLFEERDSTNLFHSIQRLGYAQIQTGKKEEGRENINKFRTMIQSNLENKEMAGDIFVPGYYDLATMAAFEDHKEEAYDYLEKAWNNRERGNFFKFFIMNDPFWDNMRGEERFQNILKEYKNEEVLKKKLLREKLDVYHTRNELKWIELDD